ncbi:hypothetical protein [Hymenobacter cavernae]|uniref:GAF domain-containing protein n=1 Tax=Hymenobacter cavernae TaxID=2044852 RepID=A0ABQ1UVH5_9BACT|nr:hypothetical protein [Hymenobacter cavernae]GGF28132.1 hypothetical protein GCM10011383_44840 [Hymenobacter cavernae]
MCFYAGSLLRLPDQRPLGTRCLIDRRPRTFTAAEQRVLNLLAALVSQAIALRLTCLPSLGQGRRLAAFALSYAERKHPYLCPQRSESG